MNRQIQSLLFLSILLLSFLSVLNLASAQNETNNSLTNNTSITRGVDLSSTIGKIDFNFDRSIQVPEKYQIPARILFGIQGEIPLQLLIIIIGVFICLAVLISEILKSMPFANEGLQRYAIAFIVTALVGVSGAILEVSTFFLNLANMFNILSKWPALAVVVALGIVALLAYGLSIIIRLIEHKTGLAE